jgi:hypothetical protein
LSQENRSTTRAGSDVGMIIIAIEGHSWHNYYSVNSENNRVKELTASESQCIVYSSLNNGCKDFLACAEVVAHMMGVNAMCKIYVCVKSGCQYYLATWYAGEGRPGITASADIAKKFMQGDVDLERQLVWVKETYPNAYIGA